MESNLRTIEKHLLIHADAAYNLARWLTRDEQDAKDIVQEAFMRAFRFFGDLEGADSAKPWLLQIVRNTAFSWMKRNRDKFNLVELDEEAHAESDPAPGPEERVLRQAESARVRSALEVLAPEYREVLVLREMEELSYQEIAEVAGIRPGTVMSRLSRARAKMLEILEAGGGERS